MAVTVASVMGIITGFIEIFKAVMELIKLARQARREGWIQEGREITKKIKGLKTDAQRREAVKKLAKYFGDMPS